MPSDPRSPRPNSHLAERRLLLCVSGGIAAYKIAYLARSLVSAGAAVQVIMTDSAKRFVGPDTFAAITSNPVHTSLWEASGEVLHVELAHAADAAVVAPATANTIAKLAQGRADDLVTSTLLETSSPILVAPAMHTGMWEHPATQANVSALEARGVTIVGPGEGELAAGDVGIGRMAEPDQIVTAVEAILRRSTDLEGRRIVVTAGPTYEPIDPVRFVGNRSTGRMGIAVAAEAAARGADVLLILGPGTVAPPSRLKVLKVQTAEDMRTEVLRSIDGSDALVMAAAVSDFRPRSPSASKLKKAGGPPPISLEPTPDILTEVARTRGGAIVVGFAAETGRLEEEGRRKLASKGLDVIVVNEVGRQGTGFGSVTNDAMILSADGDDEPLRTWKKAELASAICDRLTKLLATRP